MKKYKLLRIPADERLNYLQERLTEGKFKMFSELFLFVPKTTIAEWAGMKVDRFNFCFQKDPGGFKLGQFFKLGRYLEVDPWLLIRLIEAEVKQNAESNG